MGEINAYHASGSEGEGIYITPADTTWSVYQGEGRSLDAAVNFMQANPFMAPEVHRRHLAEIGVEPAVIQEADVVVNDLK